MTLTLQNARLLINKGGITRLNTDDALLHGIASGLPISGSGVFQALPGGDSNDGGPGRRDITSVHDLGAAQHASHTQVFGMVKFTSNNSQAALAFDRWTTIMGGSILWVMDGEPGFASALGDNSGLRQWVDYHFRVNAGRVELVRRAFISDTAALYVVLAHTITYKLRTGNWT